MYKSETGKIRHLVLDYCKGNGVDLGAGGDKITPEAVSVDLVNQYANTGEDVTELKGDASKLVWFKSKTLDYVYSSHLLEDFENTKEVMTEWVRVIKKGGYLILNLPDEQVYREHCKNNGASINANHKHEFFNKEYIKNIATEIGNLELVFETENIDYTFVVVFKKNG